MMKKLYSTNGIRLAAFLGGPLAFGYLMYRNYKSFGLDREAKNTLWISIGAAIILFGILLSLPEDISGRIPNIFFPLILSSIGDELAKKYQKSKIDRSVEEGTAIVWSNWRAAGIALFWCLITFGIVFAFVLPFNL